MRKIKMKNVLTIAAMIFSMVLCGALPVSAQTDVTRVWSYDDLPVNYVKFRSPTFDQCTFESSNPNVCMMDYYDLGKGVVPHIVYKGPLNWGTNRTTTQNASLGKLVVPGTFSLRANGLATLPDGTKADLKLTFSDWEISVGTRPSGVSANQTLYTCILNDCHGLLKYKTANPKTSPTATKGIDTNTAQRITTTVSVLKSGTDEPISAEDYPNMLIEWRDFDISDLTTATQGSDATRYAGKYAEGIGLISGFGDIYYATPNTCTVSHIVDGVQKIRGSRYDDNTLDSGAVFAVSPQGYSYYWYGSRAPSGGTAANSMGSDFQGSPEVTVLASKGNGGSIEKEGVTSYVLNGRTSYDYTPDEAYKVKMLTVNGEDIPFEEDGGTYVFDKLLERNENGYDYTIDVQFRRYAYNIETSAENGRITETEKNIPEGENRVITYTPDEGCQLRSLTVDGNPVDIKEYPVSYPFTNINEDHNIRAVFEKTPVLEVEKTADREVYNAGDRATYTIKVKQTVEGAEARDVVIKDTLPEGLVLDQGSISGPVQIVNTSEDSYELRIGSLTDEVIYTYTAVTDSDVDGEDLENIVNVTAGNISDGPAEARAKISALKPRPSITKIVSNEEPLHDEEVVYTISIKEPTEGVELRNATVTDEIPEGIEVIEDSIATEGDEASVSMTDGRIVANIPVLSGETVITFRARVTAEEGSVVNTAVLTGDGISELKADATITVREPQKVMAMMEVKDDPGEEPEPEKKDDPVKEKDPPAARQAKTGDDAISYIVTAVIAMLLSLCGVLAATRRRI